MEMPTMDRLSGVKVLLVEDSIDSQRLVARFLEGAGAEVETAGSGVEGVSKALANNYDIVLMDIQMPDITGYEAASLLRNRNFARPIIAITATVAKGERQRCLEAGCDEQLTKPVDSNTLVEIVARNTGRTVDPKMKQGNITIH
jgi:CheY-like chemotaxis protein